LIDAVNDPQYPAQIVVVCANRACPAIAIAQRAELPVQLFRLSQFADRTARDLAMAQLLRRNGVDLVVCAGYDTILTPDFIDAFSGRIINIHPSLLPEFAGTMDAVSMALAAGVAESGCTVHVVTDEVDGGPILAQRRVAVRSSDTIETLRARIQREEHRLLPEVVKRMASEALPLPV
jgi:phosphoribosylglycinamide formyltransferase-1